MSVTALNEAIKTYGPFAFGVAALLLIWGMIVQPEMDRRTIDYDAHKQLLSAQQEIVSSQREITASQAATAKMLEQLVHELLEDGRNHDVSN